MALASLLVAACGSAALSSEAASPLPHTGITVSTIASPTCPLSRPGQVCTAPVSVDVTITRPNGSPVVTFHTDASGRATVSLAPGSYMVAGGAVSVAEPLPMTPAPKPVLVHKGAYTTVALVYDTGIR